MRREGLVDSLRRRTPAMVDALARLIGAESPSEDRDLTAACAAVVGDLCEEILGVGPERRDVDGAVHLLLQGGGSPRVLLLGHLDTVWPSGTLARWPFSVDQDRATGPGAFDMKAGIVQGIFALSVLDDIDGISMLFTSDEEIGSDTSRELIEETARGCSAVLVLEPSMDGALKTARKGVSGYILEIVGRAAHAGLEPEKGANALVQLAHTVLALEGLGRQERGTTVTPTLASAGSAVNVVPANATVAIDVRTTSIEEQERVDRAVRELVSETPDTRLLVSGGPNRPPLDASASAALFGRAAEIADELSIGRLEGAAVGGGSDGNFTAALGIPTLDGLGAVGNGAHAEGEYVVVSAMSERAALVAALIDDVLAGGIGSSDEASRQDSHPPTNRAAPRDGTIRAR